MGFVFFSRSLSSRFTGRSATAAARPLVVGHQSTTRARRNSCRSRFDTFSGNWCIGQSNVLRIKELRGCELSSQSGPVNAMNHRKNVGMAYYWVYLINQTITVHLSASAFFLLKIPVFQDWNMLKPTSLSLFIPNFVSCGREANKARNDGSGSSTDSGSTVKAVWPCKSCRFFSWVLNRNTL